MMRSLLLCLWAAALATSSAKGQPGVDPETAYAIQLEKQADVVIDYDHPIRISAPGQTMRRFDHESEGFAYIESSLKKRNLVVLILGKVIRNENEALGSLADRLQGKLLKLGFKTIVFELASGTGRPIYRIFQTP